jgi:hypothetical protein
LRWGRQWSLRGLKFAREKFAETEANKQTFGEVDSCCAVDKFARQLSAGCKSLAQEKTNILFFVFSQF